MIEVPIAPIHVDQIRAAIGSERCDQFLAQTEAHRCRLEGATIWHINSTARGGGVAEMLQSLLAYARGMDIETRWLVVEGNAPFFLITKRLHNNIHGDPGDGGPLGDEQRLPYEHALADNARPIASLLKPQDIVVCHDPQTAGLIDCLRETGAKVIWRCHIGHNDWDEHVERAWAFLAPYLQNADRYVFTREAFVPPTIDKSRSVIVPPSIDPLSPKNQPLTEEVVRAILIKTGVMEGPNGNAAPKFRREDGSTGTVERAADVIRLGRPPALDRPVIVQVSHWDRLKDPIGVMSAFTDYVVGDEVSLILAGPNVSAVADDPEGGQVLDDVFRAWRGLPHEVRRHVHINCLPMMDREENAAIVNAIQRHATIIVQKSLFEGFGLTVTEAMWKGRPVVATAVGGIQDQIEDGVSGLLIQDPNDLETFGRALKRLLKDPKLCSELATRGQKRVEDHFLFTRHLTQYLELFNELKS